MARLSNQKLKLLYIADMLGKETDDNHSLTATEISKRLAAYGVPSERKSIYDDIEQLRQFGYDIVLRAETPKGYFLASREFELPELKLLVDAVASSKFITEQKSRDLIGKLEKLTSRYEAGSLQRQVIVNNRVKTGNEGVYYNIDTIHEAINCGRKISFLYGEWTVEKKMEYRRDGSRYIVSPWALTWDDENYYMLAYDDEAELIKHYRVDKMAKLAVENESREGKYAFHKIDLSSYAKKVFGMFRGEDETVKVRFDNQLAGVVIDRFGKDVVMLKQSDDSFIARFPVELSPQFFGWLTALGSRAELVEPESARTMYQEYLEEILRRYE